MQQRLLYVSRIATGLTDLDVHRIVASARIRNRRLDITGVLAMGRRLFAQVLEGDRDDLRELMRSIADDARHGDVRVLMDRSTGQRMFQRWDMTLLQAESLDGVLDSAYDTVASLDEDWENGPVDRAGNPAASAGAAEAAVADIAEDLIHRLLAQANDDRH